MFDPEKVAMEIVSEPKEDKDEKEKGGPGKHALIAMMEAARSGDYETAWEAFEAAVAACESGASADDYEVG